MRRLSTAVLVVPTHRLVGQLFDQAKKLLK
jgi:hypothetical protein